MIGTLPADGIIFFERISTYLTPIEVDQVRDAFHFARETHSDQMRGTGEPFFTHPLTVAYYLAEYQLDSSALIAALLHDVAEDTLVSVQEIREMYGEDVAHIVNGVTKFEQSAEDIEKQGLLDKKSRNERTLRKLFMFMAKDVRVVLIKLFDRLHNLRTLEGLPLDKQKKKARETLDIYAPLAYRLGLWHVKNELESLAFMYLDEATYQLYCDTIQQRTDSQKNLIDQISSDLTTEFERAGLPVVSITLSQRHPYSIHVNKSQSNKRMHVHQLIDDIPRVMVIVNDLASCYEALGLIHSIWQPQPREFEDYIARSRDNLYRALHTTVLHSCGRPIKFRIRSYAMSFISDYGVLGLWSKDDNLSPIIQADIDTHLNELITAIEQINNSGDTMQGAVQDLMSDLLSKQIAVYTPAGECIKLPRRATPLDFAYAIHTEVGHTCYQAYVNNELVPLNIPLQEGDLVRITRQGGAPRRNWLSQDLGYLHTLNAKAAVRRWFRRLDTAVARVQGQQMLEREMVLIGLPTMNHDEIAHLMGYESAEALHIAVGRAEILSPEIAAHILSNHWQDGIIRKVGRTIELMNGRKAIILGVPAYGNLRICQNCKPEVGMAVLGFVRSTQDVTVHQISCSYLPDQTESDQLVYLRWGEDVLSEVREVDICIDIYDRPNLFLEISSLLSKESINIAATKSYRTSMGGFMSLRLDVSSPHQLIWVLHKIRALVNVRDIRAVPGPIAPIEQVYK